MSSSVFPTQEVSLPTCPLYFLRREAKHALSDAGPPKSCSLIAKVTCVRVFNGAIT